MSSRINSMLFWIGGQIVTCESKRHYPTQARALLCARKFKKPLSAYRCPICNEWHLTKGIVK